LDRCHWAIRSAQIWSVVGDDERGLRWISLRTGIQTRAHLESTRKRALRREKPDQAGVRSQSDCEPFSLKFGVFRVGETNLSLEKPPGKREKANMEKIFAISVPNLYNRETEECLKPR
jgi:hypothetical protein